MPSTIQGGSIGRWFEELCRIKYETIAEIVWKNGTSLKPNILPKSGGVYTFWWTGDLRLLTSPSCNRLLELVGPGGKPVILEIDDNWLGISTELPIPLYTGKSASGLAKRIGQNLRLSKARILPIRGGVKKAKAPSTTCQLRAGIEHLFRSESNTRGIVLDNIGISFVELEGDENAANRFYLEDLAIGLMRPPLNIDIER